ncbi:hypothetical protein AMELA_G00036510 [Ameiurus melas]|uniref:Uncharacterized protein n=1 Tax=Ameiurus melas TaxID=219545 RepID=A0A7J6B8L1_AMEME|nr:hypothetical protein AMELA_G00036510 [Ameiurus melas]
MLCDRQKGQGKAKGARRRIRDASTCARAPHALFLCSAPTESHEKISTLIGPDGYKNAPPLPSRKEGCDILSN